MRAFLVLVVAVIVGAVWWLLFDARTPGHADSEFDVAAYRALIDADGRAADDVRIAKIGGDLIPAYAAEAGGGFGKVAIAYPAMQVISENSDIIIGAAVDDLTASAMAQSDDAYFNTDAYQALLGAMNDADAIYITHEHLDHVMAITRNPAPEKIVGKLRLTAAQLDPLDQFAPPGQSLDPAFNAATPFKLSQPMLIAPGVVAALAPGHSPGSIVFFVRRVDGMEYFLIGDIAWNASNISHLKTRPRILQYLFFKGGEDRKAILRQIRALHDIAEAEPGLLILPEHDEAVIDAAIASGALTQGFAVHAGNEAAVD